jgi:release factor glutamine methyltransferase
MAEPIGGSPTGAKVTVRALLETSVTSLAAAGIAQPRVDAEWLLADTLGLRRLELFHVLDRRPSVADAARCAERIGRRARREPLQHILGWEEFRGRRFRVTPEVLIPRPETEILVEWALELLPPGDQTRRPVALDLGTGSGCIACALAAERADVAVVALEISPQAAAVAASNVHSLGLDGRVRVVVSDLFAALRPLTADLVVANPPYLPSALIPRLAPEVRDGDPWLALDGGPDGLRLIRRIVANAPRWLRPGGAIALETAGGEAAHAAAVLLHAEGFTDVRSRADLAGITRFVAGRMA